MSNTSLNPKAIPLLPYICSLPVSYLNNEEVAKQIMHSVAVKYGISAVDIASPETLAMGAMLVLLFSYDYSIVADKVVTNQTLDTVIELHRQGKLAKAVERVKNSINH